MEALETGSGRQPPNDRDTERTDTTTSEDRRSGLNDPNVCRTVSGIVLQDGEDLLTKGNGIIHALGNDVLTRVQITGETRLRSYIHDRPSMINISIRNFKKRSSCYATNIFLTKGSVQECLHQKQQVSC
ncbi:hypothetical protein DPMN_039204 [Dreissena polymorpha]|uniref:Uncharacterized protein n=1 Tax=Dreissena polymorpha TaxID=45954 RepID=A0A9D4RRE9_DREPO|nr:hypothetical protein DPMN_039204 [Dreissena polymorpha]